MWRLIAYIKAALRAILGAKQYERLSCARRGCQRSFFRIFFRILNTLPDRILLDLKEQIGLVRKLDYPRVDIFLAVDSHVESETRVHSCKKEPEMIDWIEGFFEEGDVFFDIGANVGAYSLVAAKFSQQSVKVLAFEPSFSNYAQLCKNIFLNNCEEWVLPLQLALSDRTAVDVLHYHDLSPGSALHSFGTPENQRSDLLRFKQRVLAFRLDDIIEQFCFPLPTHLKIDVDGTELQILDGAEKTISKNTVKSIMVEVEEGSEEADLIVAQLKGKRFNLLSKHKFIHGGDTGPFSRTYNYLFHREMPGQEREDTSASDVAT